LTKRAKLSTSSSGAVAYSLRPETVKTSVMPSGFTFESSSAIESLLIVKP